MPTHTPITGVPASTAATQRRLEAHRAQRPDAWPKCPTPGITIASAPASAAGAAATRTDAPTRSSARETEWRFPLP